LEDLVNATTKTLISGHKLFAGLDPQHIETLTEYSTERQIRAGEILFSQGGSAKTFYVILSGTVIVETPAIYGPTLVLQELGPGKILGWSWLIPPYHWHFQARAGVDSVVLEFDGAGLLALCEKDSEFGYQLLKRFASLMGDRLESARRRMMDAWNPAGFA
jgi:CRP-like cAMP-binding protein